MKKIDYDEALKIAQELCKALPNGEEKDTIVYYTTLGVCKGYETNVPEDDGKPKAVKRGWAYKGDDGKVRFFKQKPHDPEEIPLPLQQMCTADPIIWSIPDILPELSESKEPLQVEFEVRII